MEQVLPRKRFTATDYHEVRVAFEAYHAQAAATGKPAIVWVSCDPAKGQRRWQNMDITLKDIQHGKKFANPPEPIDQRTKQQIAA